MPQAVSPSHREAFGLSPYPKKGARADVLNPLPGFQPKKVPAAMVGQQLKKQKSDTGIRKFLKRVCRYVGEAEP